MDLLLSLRVFATILVILLFLRVHFLSELPITNGVPPGRELMARHYFDLIDGGSERIVIFLATARTGCNWSREGCRRL